MTEIILGPPGTGKTTTLLELVENALERGVAPDRIGYVTFTKKGATEAVERACKKFNLSKDQLPYFQTLHSMCYRQLGLGSKDVLMGKTFFEFADFARIRVTGRSWSDDGLLTGFETGDRILFMENLARIRCVELRQQYEESDDNVPWNEVQRVSKALVEFKRSRGLLDFTDMLSEFIEQRCNPRLEELYVDEAQDLSALQWRVVEALAVGCRRVVVAGDDDQAIYRWAGADVEHLINMEGDVRVLGQSYRVPPAIQAAADEVIRKVAARRPKAWKAKAGGLDVVERRKSFEDVDRGRGSVLVLVRNQYILKEQVEPALRRAGVIYDRNGKSSIDPGASRAAFTWEDLKRGEPVTLGDVREMYEYLSANKSVKRGFKKLPTFGDNNDEPVTMHDLIDHGGLLVDPNLIWHEALDKLPPDEMTYMLAIRKHGEKLRGGSPRVKVSTIHSAKGGEADHVILMSEIAQRTYREMEANPDDERRVWYVAATRAKERLTIVASETNRECPWL